MRSLIFVLLVAAQPTSAIVAPPAAWVGTLQLCAATVRAVTPSTNRQTGQRTLLVSLTPSGTSQFAALTERMIGKPLPVRINGMVISSPTVLTAVRGGRFEVVGASVENGKRLAALAANRCGRPARDGRRNG